MFGEFTIIAFSAVVGIEDVVEEDDDVTHKISAYVITRGVEIYRALHIFGDRPQIMYGCISVFHNILLSLEVLIMCELNLKLQSKCA
jgi:hypothetical protein